MNVAITDKIKSENPCSILKSNYNIALIIYIIYSILISQEGDKPCQKKSALWI